jgi:hypothetical protein
VTDPQTKTVEPTGLDYHEAYAAMFPGLKADGIRIQDLQDTHLKTVDRAARLRRAERERVKAECLALFRSLDPVEITTIGPEHIVVEMTKLMEEIR